MVRFGFGGRSSRKVRRQLDAGQRRVRDAVDIIGRLAAIDDETVVVDGRINTVGELKRELPDLVSRADAEDGSKRHDRPDRTLRAVGRGLLVVNGVALAVVGARLMPVDSEHPSVGALLDVAVLPVLAIGGQAVLAASLGRRLWGHRHADDGTSESSEVPSRDAVVLLGAGSLIGLIMLAAVAIYTHVVATAGRSADPRAVSALGAALAVSMVAAPLCIVANVAHGPSPTRRRLARVSHILDRAHRATRRLDPQVGEQLDMAEAHLARARDRLENYTSGDTRQGRSGGAPVWSYAVEQLASSIAFARAAHRDVKGPPDPGTPQEPTSRDDVDLVG